MVMLWKVLFHVRFEEIISNFFEWFLRIGEFGDDNWNRFLVQVIVVLNFNYMEREVRWRKGRFKHFYSFYYERIFSRFYEGCLFGYISWLILILFLLQGGFLWLW